jgi:hypothetical protein
MKGFKNTETSPAKSIYGASQSSSQVEYLMSSLQQLIWLKSIHVAEADVGIGRRLHYVKIMPRLSFYTQTNIVSHMSLVHLCVTGELYTNTRSSILILIRVITVTKRKETSDGKGETMNYTSKNCDIRFRCGHWQVSRNLIKFAEE